MDYEYYYDEPLNILKKIGRLTSELSDGELSFLCGLIRKKHPKKILEIGVSAGGTTCVILKCLEKLKYDTKIYSVDLSFNYHYNNDLSCGYAIDNAKCELKNIDKHTLILGKNIAEVLDVIVEDGLIDMLILDTTHYLPGELLDFIVCLPYLSNGAVVILDDLNFAHVGENTNAIATRVLFDSVVAEKILPIGNDTKLGAFIINRETRKFSNSLFHALVTPWDSYDEKLLNPYTKRIEKDYSKNEINLYTQAVRLNKKTCEKKNNIKETIDELLEYFEMHRDSDIYIYGAGQRGKALGGFLLDRGKDFSGYIVSDDRKINLKERIYDKPIKHRCEINESDKLILALHDDNLRELLKKEKREFYDIKSYIFPFIKEYCKVLLFQYN